MNTGKPHTLAEIKRLAAATGRPPGVRLFESETGIKESDWYPDLWLRWGDALQEAGFKRNTMQEALSDDLLLERYSRLARRLKRLPLQGELIRESKIDPTFPSEKTYRRFGGKAALRRAVAKFCRSSSAYQDVLSLCEGEPQPQSSDDEGAEAGKLAIGYVYLLRHGLRREYKIGRTNNPIRREGEISVELPQRLEPIHVITTDDPAGIEAYWHRRFAEKRLRNEWFALTQDDLRAFKRWRRIA